MSQRPICFSQAAMRFGVFILAFLIAVGLRFGEVSAQTTPLAGGDFVGSLGPLHLKLHVNVAIDGTFTGTLDSPNQGAMGIPCADFHLEGHTLSFDVPSVHGKWEGTIENGGATLVGTWNQGRPLPLTFVRDTFPAAEKPAPVDGFWLGTLQASGRSLRIQLSVRSDRAGQQSCTLDSLDQGAFALPCANVTFSGADFSFDLPVVEGHWRGKVSSDAQSLVGTWTQGTSLPLDFQRQRALIAPHPARKLSYDPAIAPIDAVGMQAVLDRDLEQALKGGALSAETSAGVVIGVMRNGIRRVFAYGAAKPDSIFEIGSLTKTFTGLVLAQLIAQRKVRLDEPVRELLPPGTVAKPAGAEITLVDLITQHSGLPRVPSNLNLLKADNPYADYHAADLYQFLGKHGVDKPADVSFLYSNLGVGLLGQALANRAGTSYANLVADEVTGPLGLRDTVVSLSRGQQARFIQGHSADHSPARAWDFDALAGAGALRSTADDMLKYLEANLHPEKLTIAESKGGSTLVAALTQSHELRDEAGPQMRIAFAWLYDPETGNYWHNGATGGYSAYAFFNAKDDWAAVVLMNTTIRSLGSSFADLLGQHISQRFAGKPAVSLFD